MNGRSLLHYAADAGNFDVLKELISHGANVNVKENLLPFLLSDPNRSLMTISRVKTNLV